jgi:hypothetical protein
MSNTTRVTDRTGQFEDGTELRLGKEPGQDLPTMPDPGKSNPEGGEHLPTMPDPANDPKRGQKLPTEPDPSQRPVPIDDPSMGDEPIEKIA